MRLTMSAGVQKSSDGRPYSEDTLLHEIDGNMLGIIHLARLSTGRLETSA